ncbi:Aspartic proteinase nepenthesin-2 [Ananas comosus]|uniref:Aspartic proteinase nepenthesin-2 n=1 Tax=Ananas comosus TaxID=4615 RepID=A0A199UF25_ANACO|nr:Aspartic proteinase nepenthesin-2 [Ananas comosus]
MAKLLPLLLALLLSFVADLFVAPLATAMRVPLNQIDSKGNFTMAELIRRAARRSYNRVAALETKLARTTTSFNGSTRVKYGSYEYLMELSIGTPPVPLSSMMDTGSNLIWTQCKPCVRCFKQPTPMYDRTESSTFSQLGCTTPQCIDLSKYTPTNCTQSACQYSYGYADGSYTNGVLATETFTFGSINAPPISVPSVAFGCSDDSVVDFQGISGIVGLAKGELSLVAFLNTPRFAYCLTTYFDASGSSTLLLGSSAELKESGKAQTTPLLSNPYRSDFYYYYIRLKGISIGETLLRIPPSTFEITHDGSGGLIIDSGTSVTHLVERAYSTVRQAVIDLVTLPRVNGTFDALDLCFVLPSSGQLPDMPDMTLHFDGADMRLQKENYMIVVPESGLICLAMIASLTLSILGNYQQQNMQILYDLESSTLSFEPAQCDVL